jgi:acetyl/propionyl-CoA carboxylase alpha subunit
VVGPHYDALLAKVIAHGRTRADAARRLARALAGARVHGVTTNRSLLLGILSEPEFLAGRTDTGYLTRHDPAALGRPAAAVTNRHAAAAALARQAAHRAAARVLRSLPSGWRNVPSAPQRVSYVADEEEYAVSYRLHGPGSGSGSGSESGSEPGSGSGSGSGSTSGAGTGAVAELAVNGEPLGARIVVYAASPDTVDLEVDGIRRAYSVHRVSQGSRTSVFVDGPDGSSSLTEVPRFAGPTAADRGGSLLSPMPGLVVRVLAEAGAAVTAGQPLVVLEAMKMEHEVTAPAAGIVTELRAAAGQQVEAGQVLAVVTAGTPSAGQQADTGRTPSEPAGGRQAEAGHVSGEPSAGQPAGDQPGAES